MGLSFVYAGVAESEQAANLKFVGFIACGFESRLRYQKYFKGDALQMEVRVDERKVTCSKCGCSTIITRDSVLPGWIFQDSGWALVNYTYFCPRCNEDRLRNLKFDISIEEDDDQCLTYTITNTKKYISTNIVRNVNIEKLLKSMNHAANVLTNQLINILISLLNLRRRSNHVQV